MQSKGVSATENTASPRLSGRSAEIHSQMQALAGWDLRLWSITLLIFLVLVLGFAALVAPNLLGATETMKVESRYLPQVFFGFVSLILLFNLYILGQKRELSATRRALLEELMLNGRMDGFALIDPLTQLYNRRCLDHMLAGEMARSNRFGTPLSILLMNLDGLDQAKENSAKHPVEVSLVQLAQLIKSTFRGSDIVFRYGQQEFLVVMPETTEQLAECALERFLRQVERWNMESRIPGELSLHGGIAEYFAGNTAPDVLERAHRKVFLKKNGPVPVF
jgi:diguanylate cyclase (GGDEF)-like protein